jgi:hypothetical protein
MRLTSSFAAGCGAGVLLVAFMTGGSGCSSAEFSTGKNELGADSSAGTGASSSSTGGHSATGGRGAGGVNAGGKSTGGKSAGGSANGGALSAGGTVQGGAAGVAGTGAGGLAAGGGVGMGGGVVGAESGVISPLRGCDNATPYHVSNGPMTSTADTGFDVCASSWVARRRVAKACPLGPTTPDANQCNPSYCSSDADCTQQPHGFCSEVRHLAGYCGCYYGCMQDSDCAPGNICFCGTPVGHCVPTTCLDDSSCAAGSMCASYLAPCDADAAVPYGGACTGAVNGCFAGFACQNSADECLYDTDCPTDKARCDLRSGRRRCEPVCPGPPPPTP